MAIKIVITAENGEDARQQMLNLLGTGTPISMVPQERLSAIRESITEVLVEAAKEADLQPEEKKTRTRKTTGSATFVRDEAPAEVIPAAPAEEVTPAPATAAKEISNEDLRTVLVPVKDNKAEGIKTLLVKFGVKKATDLEQSQRVDFLNQVNALP
jgi:hypothetical protein